MLSPPKNTPDNLILSSKENLNQQPAFSQFDNLSLVEAVRDDMASLEQLPPFLRTLLLTDGTVTRSLEAYFWEPIDVVQIEQAEQACPADLPELELATGATALYRLVELRGRQSGRLYSSASSVIKTGDIPGNWRDELLAGRLGIGTLISDSGMESYRKIMEFSLESSSEVSRRYLIYLNHTA